MKQFEHGLVMTIMIERKDRSFLHPLVMGHEIWDSSSAISSKDQEGEKMFSQFPAVMKSSPHFSK